MGNEIKDLPKTKHEEIMFCIESTNDIVSATSERVKIILTKIKSINERIIRLREKVDAL